METMEKVETPSSSKDFSCQVEQKTQEETTDCAICLEQLTDKSFTNSCLHMFCFHCLMAWSKIKPECPLCKQDFSSIIHNIRSMTEYDEYHVPPPEARLSVFVNPAINPNPVFARDPRDFFASSNRSIFSYRTTISGYRLPRGRSDNLLIQPYVDNLEIQADFSRMNPNPSPVRYARRELYLKGLDTLPPPSAGRQRQCSPEFYRENETQLHRLVRWLQRELTALSQVVIRLNTQELLTRIMDMLPVYHINSNTFFDAINPYLGQHSARFIQEFHRFAVSPFEMEQYDRDCLFIRQRSGSQLSFIVTVGRDDSEDVQIIPNASTSNHSFGSWIDVNDLGRSHPSTSTNGGTSLFSSVRSSSSSQSAQNDQPSTSSASQSIIDISDSENEDCIIIDQVRAPQEIIILDDSEDEVPNTRTCSPPKSTTKSPSEGLHSPSTSSQCTVSVQPSTATSPPDQATTVKNESDVDSKKVRGKRPILSAQELEKLLSAQPYDTPPSSCSSIVSTDPSSDERDLDASNRKGKRERSKKYYRAKDIKRKRKTSSRSILEPSSEEVVVLTDSSDEETEQSYSDWEENFIRDLKTKAVKDLEHTFSNSEYRITTRSCSKTQNLVKKNQNIPKDRRKLTPTNEDQVSGTPRPRLRSVVKRVENRPTIRSRRARKSSISSTVCSCSDLQSQNEPCTSQGIRSLHRDTCPFYLIAPVSRNMYSSDSD